MKFLIKLLAIFNLSEGFIHIGVAIVSLWGIFDTGTYDWRLFFAPIENLIFGLFSLLTGWVLGKDHHRKNPPDNNLEEEKQGQ